MVTIVVANSKNNVYLVKRYCPYAIIPEDTYIKLHNGKNDISCKYGFYFSFCGNNQNVIDIDLSNFNTHNIISMNSMFSNCESLTSLNLSSFDTSNVTDMRNMFGYCWNLKKLDLSCFDTRNVTDISYMFYCCANLEKLDLSNFTIKNIRGYNFMFYGCNKLKYIKCTQECKDWFIQHWYEIGLSDWMRNDLGFWDIID